MPANAHKSCILDAIAATEERDEFSAGYPLWHCRGVGVFLDGWGIASLSGCGPPPASDVFRRPTCGEQSETVIPLFRFLSAFASIPSSFSSRGFLDVQEKKAY